MRRPCDSVTSRASAANRARADLKLLAVEAQDGAAACRDGVDGEHRCAHAYARDQCLELPFCVAEALAGEM
jgi:hypothetical protein